MTDSTPAPLPELVPARMLNEFTYCPRLAYLEWVQGEWADNLETVEGKRAHGRVDQAEGERAEIHRRSVKLSSERLGLVAVVDLVESDGGRVRPVDYKRGKRPPVAGGAWEPEKVQLCVQGLLLREHGYECREGILYFVAAKQRVRVRFTDGLVARTLELLARMRTELGAGMIPPPLEDSPKCPRCSLVRICLPEEVGFLRRGGPVRPLVVAEEPRFPLVVQEPGATVRLSGERLHVETTEGVVARVRTGEVSQLVLMSGAHPTGAALRECCDRGIPIVHLSGSGWLHGLTHGFPSKNVELRIAQFAAARDGEASLQIARGLVAAKVHNTRVLLRRNGHPPREALQILARETTRAERTADAETLLGLEGSAARAYFGAFATMLKGAATDAGFDVAGRTRRPPTDPVNALLSFAYTLLVKDWTVVLYAVGLDPMLGFFHAPRYGRPALALDLMEPFRPVIADSVVVGVLNNGEIGGGDFYERHGAVLLKPPARKRLVAAYERRLGQEIRHPLFGYRCTYRRIFELEARLLGRFLLGEIASFPGFRIR